MVRYVMATIGNDESVANRLKKLEDIEKKITSAIKVAGSTLEELSKEKPVDKTVEKHSGNFVQLLEEIEGELSSQIVYLSQAATIHQHEGSAYANLKRVHLLNDAMCHVSRQIDEILSSIDKGQPIQQK